MKKLIVALGALVLIFGCNNSSKSLLINGNNYKIFNPPATKEVASNIYIDEAELTNIDYKEYLFWLKRTYGKDSNEYKEAQPDLTVWRKANVKLRKNESEYFQDSKYNSHPIVGINLSQGKKYSKWRSDRVAEMMLITKGYVEISVEQKRDNHFTIERYMSGKYKWTKKQVKKMAFPIYKIPSKNDWENYILNNVDEQLKKDREFKGNKKLVKQGGDLYNVKINNPSDEIIEGPKVGKGYAKTAKGLTHVIGNVSEMINSDNKSMGGNWTIELKDIDINKGENFEQANYYTGLRNICQWEERVLVNE